MLYNTFPYLFVPPTAEAITEDTARKWLRLETGVTDSDSDMIKMCVDSAVKTFERVTMLQVMEATYQWVLPCFPDYIPYYVNIADIVIGYKEDKMATAWTPLDATKYQFYQQGYRQNALEYATDIQTISPQIVRVSFKTGYATATEIPADWLMPIRAILAEVWDNRMDGLADKTRLSEKLMANYAILAVR